MNVCARFRPSRSKALTVVLALMQMSCAALGERARAPRAVAFDLSHGYYLLDFESYELRELDAGAAPEGLRLVFLLVRGAINGRPDPEVFRSIPVQPDARFTLRLPARIPGTVPAFDSDALRMQPPTTRVARLGTFHDFPEYGVFRGGGGFVHAPSGAPILLLHFSAPARIRGSRQEPAGVHRYLVDVERPGWSWLIVHAISDGDGFEVRRYTGPVDEVRFVVLLPPLMIGR